MSSPAREAAEARARELCQTQGPQAVWQTGKDRWAVTGYRKGDELRHEFAAVFAPRDTSKSLSLSNVVVEHGPERGRAEVV